MGNKYKQQEENINICRKALKKAKTPSERSAAEHNLRAAEEHLENLKKADAYFESNSKKKNRKKNKKSSVKKKAGCLWTILKICTLGLLASAGSEK